MNSIRKQAAEDVEWAMLTALSIRSSGPHMHTIMTTEEVARLLLQQTIALRSAELAAARDGSIVHGDVPESADGVQTLRMYGHSDDLVEVEGIAGADEYSATGWRDIASAATFRLLGPEHSCRIHAIYDDRGCWSFAVAPFEEGCQLPPWPVRLSLSERGHSTVLEMDVPTGTRIDKEGTDD